MFGGLAPMHTPVHASMDDITSYCTVCSFFILRQKFLVTVTGGGRPPHVNPPREADIQKLAAVLTCVKRYSGNLQPVTIDNF